MHSSIKCVLTALAASLLLSAMVSTATARSLSFSNQNIRATWTSIEFASTVTARCQLTLEGSFHTRTVAKVARSLIGAITRAQMKRESCTGGVGAAFNGTERYNGVTPTNTLPWHLTYEGFTGTLPAINTVRILSSRFRFGIEAEPCAVQMGSATDNITGDAAIGAGGNVSALTATAGRASLEIIRTDRDFLGACPRPGSRGTLNGTGQATLLGNTTRITITLI